MNFAFVRVEVDQCTNNNCISFICKDVQATPPTSAKSLIKILTENAGEMYTFQFSAKPILQSVRNELSTIVNKFKHKDKSNTPAASTPQPEVSSASTTPKPLTRKQRLKQLQLQQRQQQNAVRLDPKTLIKNLELQEKVLRNDAQLRKAFEDAVMTRGLPNEDFWSTRIGILRAYILKTSQRRGPYNVLSTIKQEASSSQTGSQSDRDNEVKVNLSEEKILDIYEQYPIVYQAYKDNVPPMTPTQFWQAFFSSKLFRRLKGDKVHIADAHPILDKYLDYLDNMENMPGINGDSSSTLKRKRDGEEEANPAQEPDSISVPFFLNIEGNEENDPQKLGNRPDITMRSGTDGPGPLMLLKSMNRLSQKMVYGQEMLGSESSAKTISAAELPNGGNPARPTIPMHDTDESHLVDELRIKGLDSEEPPSYQELKMRPKDQDSIRQELLSTDPELVKEIESTTDGVIGVNGKDGNTTNKAVSYEEGVKYMAENLSTRLDLQQVGKSDINGSDGVDTTTDAIKRAQKHIAKTIKLRSKEAGANRTSTEMNLEQDVQANIGMIHSTSMEFLRHFWIHFLSGDPGQASAINKLITSLKKCLERINQVELSNKDEEKRQLVIAALEPLVNSIHKAMETYQSVAVANASSTTNSTANNTNNNTPTNTTTTTS